MASMMNIRGTTTPAFTIGKRGATIYQGTAAPTGGEDGDIYIRHGIDAGFYQKLNGVWILQQGASENLSDVAALTLTGDSFLGSDGTAIIQRTLAETKTLLGLGTAASYQVGTGNGQIPVLGVDGRLSPSLIPEIAISTVSVVANDAERDALTVQQGDMAVVTGSGQNYVWSGSAWIELTRPQAVTSVAGKTGNVTLSMSDILGVLSVAAGGTGLSSYTAGDLLYADGVDTLSALPIGTDGQVLRVMSGSPAWDTLQAAEVSFEPHIDQRLTSTTVQAAILELADERSYTHVSTVNPTSENDAMDTAAIGVKFRLGDAWLNTSTGKFYFCGNVATGAAQWYAATQSGITTVSQDTAPTLGGDLNVSTFRITSTGSNDIQIVPTGSGKIILGNSIFPTTIGGAGQVLKADGLGSLVWAGDAGEANTYSSLGTVTDGVEIIGVKNGVDLPFRRMIGSGIINVTTTDNSVVISATNDLIGANTGDGMGIYRNRDGSTLNFKSVKNGSNITITDSADAITVSVSGLGSAAYTESNAYATAAQGLAADTALQALSDDATPTLAGALNVQTFAITTTTTDGDIRLAPNGTGKVDIQSDANVSGRVTATALTLSDASSVNKSLTWSDYHQSMVVGSADGDVLIGNTAKWRVRNTTGAALSAGQIVGIQAADSGQLTVTTGSTARQYGMVLSTIPDQSSGFIQTVGYHTLDTTGTVQSETWQVGETLYWSGGKLTTVEPSYPKIRVGIILSVGAAGVIGLNVQRDAMLDEIADVSIVTPSNGQALVYTDGEWKNAVIDTATTFQALTDTAPYTVADAAKAVVVNATGTGMVYQALAAVAVSGSYLDLADLPTTIGQLNDLSDVTISTAAAGEILQYTGAGWENRRLSVLSKDQSSMTIAETSATIAVEGKTLAVFDAEADTSGSHIIIGNGGGAVTMTAANTGGTGDVDIILTPQESGRVVFGGTGDAILTGDPGENLIISAGGNVTTTAAGTIEIKGGTATSDNADGGNVIIKAGTGNGSGADGRVEIGDTVWPTGTGSSGQAITTDGAGNLSYTTIKSDVLPVTVISSASTHTALASECVIIRAVAGPLAVTLPDGQGLPVGKLFTVKDGNGLAATHMISIYPHAGQTIDGLSGIGIAVEWESVTVVWTGSGWAII